MLGRGLQGGVGQDLGGPRPQVSPQVSAKPRPWRGSGDRLGPWAFSPSNMAPGPLAVCLRCPQGAWLNHYPQEEASGWQVLMGWGVGQRNKGKSFF